MGGECVCVCTQMCVHVYMRMAPELLLLLTEEYSCLSFLRVVAVDQLMYIKEDLIIPQVSLILCVL